MITRPLAQKTRLVDFYEPTASNVAPADRPTLERLAAPIRRRVWRMLSRALGVEPRALAVRLLGDTLRKPSSGVRLTPHHPASAMLPAQPPCPLFEEQNGRRSLAPTKHPKTFVLIGTSEFLLPRSLRTLANRPFGGAFPRAGFVGSRRERGCMPLTPPVVRSRSFDARSNREPGLPWSRQRLRLVRPEAPSSSTKCDRLSSSAFAVEKTKSPATEARAHNGSA